MGTIEEKQKKRSNKMKLAKSVKPLKEILLAKLKVTPEGAIKDYYNSLVTNPKIKNSKRSFSCAIWFSLSNSEKDKVISASLNPDKKVGGCWQDLNDKHIDALLNKVVFQCLEELNIKLN